MKYVSAIIITLIIGCLALPNGVFAITEAEADKAYKQAVEKYKHQTEAKKAVAEVKKKAENKPPVINIVNDDISIPDHTDPNYTAGRTSAEVNIADIKLNVDLEDMPLEQVLTYVIGKVEVKAGSYQVKWRLKEENSDIKNERVNIVAETTFGEFINFLTERVKNMAGIQLFVTIFERSRIIMISDTY